MQPLELARMDELNRCYEIIEAGKRFQREQGSSNGQTIIQMSILSEMISKEKMDTL